MSLRIRVTVLGKPLEEIEKTSTKRRKK